MAAFNTDDLPSISTPTISTANILSLNDIKVPDLSAILKLPSVPGLPNLTSSIPKLDAKCGLNASIEQFNSDKKLAEDKLSSLVTGAGGITGSLGSLSSSLQNSVGDIAKSLNKNLLADAPKIGIKLQDEFHKVMDSFSSGAPSSALLKLQEIKKQFPNFDIQKALDGAAGILPTGAIPPNAAELIKGDLTKALSNLNQAIPKFEGLGNDLLSSASKFSTDAKNAIAGVTNSISGAQKSIGTALGALTAEAGNNLQLGGLTNAATNAVNSAKDSLNKLGGAFAGPAGPSASLTGASDALKKLTGNLSEGIAKIPKFDICTSIPNQQVVNGEVKELPIPPVKPTVNAEPPTPPTPAPTPATPVLVDKYSFPWWTKDMSVEFRNYVTYGGAVDGEYDVKIERVPLDTSGSWAQDYSNAYNLLYRARNTHAIERMERSDLKALGVATQGETPSLTAAQKILLANYFATLKDLEDKNILLAKYNARYNYRVKNNLIDKQE